MKVIYSDNNSKVISGQHIIFESSSAFHQIEIVITAHGTGACDLLLDGKVFKAGKVGKLPTTIFLLTFLKGGNHTIGLHTERISPIVMRSVKVSTWDTSSSITFPLEVRAEDADRRPWVTFVLDNLPIQSFIADVSYSRRKRDSNDVEIKLNNNSIRSIAVTIKFAMWRFAGALLGSISTKREAETFNVNQAVGVHVIEFVADRMPILHSVTLNFGVEPIAAVRIPTVNDPRWTGDFSDDTDEMLLARLIFGEARDERLPDSVRIGIGWSARNRLEDEKHRWKDTYYQVITGHSQYAAFNKSDKNRLFVEDPIQTALLANKRAWEKCYEIAIKILHNEAPDPTGGSNHYFDKSIKPPVWATPKTFRIKIGPILFYRR